MNFKINRAVLLLSERERVNFTFSKQNVNPNEFLTHVKKKNYFYHYITVSVFKSQVKYLKTMFFGYNTIT